MRNTHSPAMRYTLIGDPLPFLTLRHNNPREWSEIKLLRVRSVTNLTNQHTGPLITGPVSMDLEFYSPVSRAHPNLTLNPKSPILYQLIKVCQELATGTIIQDATQVVMISARKRHGHVPRMEFTITPINLRESHD